ncbi:MAG: MFS transporter [Candidatus Dormibacteraeota bacterium]|uniref:MFS transporter n=1 Tax=Candidatus Dormiibacter inghamiae TaxID=3127013 RepID=A0A934KJ66_9BACT|nr:MFS transporter [Candidatus Dormibacteraeota bacterium]MBJ7606877.1 MFS transporter [Candidatus Dormibacteraeota bacterium]PZR69673.1 MAG: hypothetical protein DLM66_05585 [Candidatus Dormibacteraeota bacterium]
MTAHPQPAPPPEPEPEPRLPDWRRNLAVLWVAQFTAILGFAFAFPFLPLYLKDLGVHRQDQLAFFSGLAGGASGLALMVASPLWGIVADRYGRKSMLVRAMIGGAVTLTLLGFARGPGDVIVLRFLQGASSGTVGAATALVATGTPRARVGWALGVLTSAVAVGSAMGPFLGGIAAGQLGLRAVFWVGGGMLALAALGAALLIRETMVPRSTAKAGTALTTLRQSGPHALAAIGALLICQAILQTAYSGFSPLLVLKLLTVIPSGAATITGVAFGISGLSSAAAAVLYAPFARRLGYRRLAVVTALGVGAGLALAGLGTMAWTMVLSAGFLGLMFGATSPALSAMLGLEVPASIQARIFGFSSSATALGFALGPLGGGSIAARWGPSTGLLCLAGATLLLAAVLVARVREPAR